MYLRLSLRGATKDSPPGSAREVAEVAYRMYASALDHFAGVRFDSVSVCLKTAADLRREHLVQHFGEVVDIDGMRSRFDVAVRALHLEQHGLAQTRKAFGISPNRLRNISPFSPKSPSIFS